MAVGESAGSVYVTIDGDISPLVAKYAQAETASRAAGAGVAAGFNTAANAADQTGASIADLIQVIREEGAAASLAAQRNAALAGSVRQIGQAAHGSVSEIQASGGAIRTAFGEQSIRAAERFVTLIPGVGAALQAVFPLIGGLALVEMLDRAFQKSEALTAAEKELQTQTENTDRAFLNMAQSIDRINAQRLGKEFGPAAGAGGEADAAKAKLGDLRNELQKAKDDMGALATEAQGKVLLRPTGGSVIEEEYAPKFAAQREKIKQVIAQIAVAEKELGEKQFEAGQAGASQSGELAATRLANSEKALTQETAMAKAVSQSQITATRAAADQRIASLDSEYARVVQTGAAEVAEAQAKEKAITDTLAAELPKRLALIRSEAAADAQGKPQSEQDKIFGAVAGKETDVKGSAALEAFNAGEATTAAQNKATLSLIELNARLAQTLKDDVTHGWDEVAKASERASQDQQKALQKDMALLLKQSEEEQRAAEGRAHIAESVGKGQGELATARVKAQYEGQISHSIQQQVAYEQTLASIEDATYTKELTALAAKLKAAQALEDETEKAKQLLDIEAQIAALSGKAQAAGVSAQGQIQKTQAQGFGQQVGQVGTSGLSSLSNALAEGVIRGGRGLGKDIRQSLQGIGKQLLGDAIKSSVEDLVIAMTGNTIATNLNTLWTELSTAVKGLFGFADGTGNAPGGWSMVGEKGPEIMHVPRGAQIIPNHALGKYADGTPGYGRAISGGRSMNVTVHAHAHGVNDPGTFARQAVAAIPHELKRQSASFSPYSS